MMPLRVHRCLVLLLSAIFVMSAVTVHGALNWGHEAGVFASVAQEFSADQKQSCPDDDGACGTAMNHGPTPSECSAMSCAVLWPTRDPVSTERNVRRLAFHFGNHSTHGSWRNRLDRPPRLT